MRSDREKLIELLNDMQTEGNKSSYVEWAGCKMKHEVKNEQIADHLIANGVTFATDNNVGDKWIPVSEPPKDHDEYLVMIKDASRPTTLWYHPKQGTWHECGATTFFTVTHWMPLPKPPKGE
jgi:hypothetical protein